MPVSIQEITEAADIGFGSFYNHFESKEQLFRTASEPGSRGYGPAACNRSHVGRRIVRLHPTLREGPSFIPNGG
jgi:AcrR family transcriptional regulator